MFECLEYVFNCIISFINCILFLLLHFELPGVLSCSFSLTMTPCSCFIVVKSSMWLLITNLVELLFCLLLWVFVWVHFPFFFLLSSIFLPTLSLITFSPSFPFFPFFWIIVSSLSSRISPLIPDGPLGKRPWTVAQGPLLVMWLVSYSGLQDRLVRPGSLTGTPSVHNILKMSSFGCVGSSCGTQDLHCITQDLSCWRGGSLALQHVGS